MRTALNEGQRKARDGMLRVLGDMDTAAEESLRIQGNICPCLEKCPGSMPNNNQNRGREVSVGVV